MVNPDRADDVRSAVAAQLPGYAIHSVALLGAGLDNVAYEVNRELVVRFSTESDPGRRATRVERDARVLAEVADIATLPVPAPRFSIPEQGCLAYTKVLGVPLLDRPAPQRSAHGKAVGAELGRLLAALHAVPVDGIAELVERDDRTPADRRDEAAEHVAALDEQVPAAYREAVKAFLASPLPDAAHTPVFSHNDLGIEHVLVDPAACAVTGVIDWSDAAISDPAHDFGLIHRDLGSEALDSALDAYGAEGDAAEALRARAVHFARCGVFADLAHGVGTEQESYVEKNLIALAWLFPIGQERSDTVSA